MELKALCLKLKEPRAAHLNLRKLRGALRKLHLKIERPSGAFRASRLKLKELGCALRPSYLKIMGAEWRAQCVAPQAPLSRFHAQGNFLQDARPLVGIPGHCASKSSSLGNFFKVSYLKLHEPGWHTQGVMCKASRA